jgi:Holliday junction resolvasome RuvABC ATP-dependent DNA helicase subunit
MRKNIPENVILLMSGVPGIGKTTLSHMILNTFPEFLFFASPFCRKLQNKNVGCCKTVL